MDVARTVRHDAVTMTRWDVIQQAALEVAQEAYGTARVLLGPLVALVLGGFIASRGPDQFKIILIATAAIVLVIPAVLDAPSLSTKVKDGFKFVWLFAVVTGVVMLVLLVLHPSHGLNVGEAYGIVVGGLELVLITVPASHMIIAHFWRILPGIVELSALAVTATIWHYVIQRHLGLTGWPDWIRLTLRVGAVAWFCTTLVLVIINTASRAFTTFLQFHKLQKAPEAEFVQSALLAMLYIEKTMKPNDDESVRKRAVSGMEYLAAVLDTNIRSALARRDPRSSAFVAEKLNQRAEAIRIHKRALLFGRPKAQSKALHFLAEAVVHSAQRNWLALPGARCGKDPWPVWWRCAQPCRRTRSPRKRSAPSAPATASSFAATA